MDEQQSEGLIEKRENMQEGIREKETNKEEARQTGNGEGASIFLLVFVRLDGFTSLPCCYSYSHNSPKP